MRPGGLITEKGTGEKEQRIITDSFETFGLKEVQEIIELLTGPKKILKLPFDLNDFVQTLAMYFDSDVSELLVGMARMFVAGMKLSLMLSEEDLLEQGEQNKWTSEQVRDFNVVFSRKIKLGILQSGKIIG